MKFNEFWGKCKTAFGKIGKKTVIAIAAVSVIALAVVLNIILYNGGADNNTVDDADQAVLTPAIDIVEASGSSANTPNDYFAEMALSRQQARDEAMEVLKSVAENTETVEEMKAEAMDDIAQIARDIEHEANIETLIRSKGFEQCVAVVNGDSASVIVASDGLLEGEIAQISEIVYEEAGIAPVSLKIIEKSLQ